MFSKEWKYYLGRYKNSYSKTVLSATMSVGLTVFVLPTIYMVKYVFDELLPAENYDMLVWVGIALVLINIIAYVLTVFARHLALKTTKQVISEIRTDLVNSSFRMSRAYFTSTDLSKMHTSMVQDTQRVDMMSNALISQFIPNVIIVAVLAVVLLYLNWMLLLTVSIIVPFLLLLKQVVKDKRTENIKKYHLSFEQFSKGTMHILQRMDLIKTQSAENVEHNSQVTNVDSVKTDGYSMAFFNNAYRLMQSTIAAQIGVVMLVVGGMAVGKGAMTIGALLSFYVAAARMSTSLNALFDALPVLMEGRESLTTLFRILEFERGHEQQGSDKIDYQGNLAFNSVSFSYGEKQVLNEVNFILQEHAITALVGANGTGKSTIVNLILGFYQPVSGNILLNGTKFLNVDYKYLRQQYGVVLQDQFFFSGTIRENLTYGLFQASEKEIKKACDFSNATEFISKLSDGVNARLGDNGVLLSGGQKQKIAIARAVLRRPKLLILDEPTNHLDNATVSLLMDRLKSLDFKPTVLIITQDRNLAMGADYVLEATEQGKVKELEPA
jgi:ATP-binding cassette subfamily B protein